MIDMKKIRYYVLTYQNELRKQHVMNLLRGYHCSCIESVKDREKFKSGALGQMKLIDKACQDMSNQTFEPFVIFEDDIEKYREFPPALDIPDNSDLLYLGISKCGMNDVSWCFEVCHDPVNEDLVRVYNMLSLHGYMICSMVGLLRLQKCFMEAYYENKEWDINVAYMQPYMYTYALKRPLVYQKQELGGQERWTKIEYKEKEKPLPEHWKIRENASIRSNYME